MAMPTLPQLNDAERIAFDKAISSGYQVVFITRPSGEQLWEVSTPASVTEVHGHDASLVKAWEQTKQKLKID